LSTGTNPGIVIPEKLLKLFENKVRVFDFGQTQGIWAIDITRIKKMSPYLEKLARSRSLTSVFDMVLVNNTPTAQADIAKLGFKPEQPQIKKFRLIGIPVPDLKIKNMDVVLTPKR
jgi:hypothetical protein